MCLLITFAQILCRVPCFHCLRTICPNQPLHAGKLSVCTVYFFVSFISFVSNLIYLIQSLCACLHPCRITASMCNFTSSLPFVRSHMFEWNITFDPTKHTKLYHQPSRLGCRYQVGCHSRQSHGKTKCASSRTLLKFVEAKDASLMQKRKKNMNSVHLLFEHVDVCNRDNRRMICEQYFLFEVQRNPIVLFSRDRITKSWCKTMLRIASKFQSTLFQFRFCPLVFFVTCWQNQPKFRNIVFLFSHIHPLATTNEFTQSKRIWISAAGLVILFLCLRLGFVWASLAK